MRHFLIFLGLLATALAAVPSPTSAQAFLTADPGRSIRTREDLLGSLETYEAYIASPAYSEAQKRELRALSAQIRNRLQNGDFRDGDRIVIYVQGELNFPDTVVVQPGPVVTLELFGDIALAGVLRSELNEHLTRELSRFLRNPVVRAEVQMQIAVVGAVGNPGYHWMQAQTTFGDALMIAGGPATNADLEKVRVERADEQLYDEAQSQLALQNGLTLDQMNIQFGDRLYMPAQPQRNILGTVLGVTGAIASMSFLLIRIF